MSKENMHEKTNRLVNEKSPYLLQHAYNPVDWFPWGEEAFAKAKNEEILVSWNGMMIAAMALAYKVLGNEKYIDAAK